jgi:hypothetical protein
MIRMVKDKGPGSDAIPEGHYSHVFPNRVIMAPRLIGRRRARPLLVRPEPNHWSVLEVRALFDWTAGRRAAPKGSPLLCDVSRLRATVQALCLDVPSGRGRPCSAVFWRQRDA